MEREKRTFSAIDEVACDDHYYAFGSDQCIRCGKHLDVDVVLSDLEQAVRSPESGPPSRSR